MTQLATWLQILFGIALGLLFGVPIAFVMQGLFTASQSDDLHKELWHVKVKLARLVQAVEGDTHTLDNEDINQALLEAHEVLER